MKKIGILIFAAALVIGLVVANIFSFGKASGPYFNFSFNFKGVKGSGTMGTETRDVTGFKGVDVGGRFEVEISAQKEYGVEIQADDNLLQYVRTEVRNGVLHIETDRRITPSSLRVKVSAPEIDSLDVSGVANVTATNIKSSSFKLDSSGASKIKLAGETGKLIVDISGATKIDAEGLATVDANVDASGASIVTLNVSGELRGDTSGASKVLYVGTPANILKNTSGAGKVGPKD